MPDPVATTPTDAELAGRIRGGPERDRSAADEIADRHRAAVLAYADLCCRDLRAAEELADEAFARTLDAVRSGSGPTDGWRPYLLAAVRRAAARWADTGREPSLSEGFASWLRNLPCTDLTEASRRAAAVAAEEASLLLRAFRSLPESSQANLWRYLEAPAGTPETPAAPGLTPAPDPAARQSLYEAYLQAYVSHTPNRSCRHLVAALGDSVRSGISAPTNELELHLPRCGSCRSARTELVAVHAWQRAILIPALLLWPGEPPADPPVAAAAAPGGAAANASAHQPAAGSRRFLGSSPRRSGVLLTAGAAVVVLAIVGVVGMRQPQSQAAPALPALPTAATPASSPPTASTSPGPSASASPSPGPSVSATTSASAATAATSGPSTPAGPSPDPSASAASPAPAGASAPASPTGSTSPPPATIPATIVGGGRYHSISAGGSGGQVLEVSGTCSSPLGAAADINTWWSDHTSEQWTFTTNPDGTVRISDNCYTPTHVHTVLTAGTAPGTNAYLLDYSPGNPSQEWRVLQSTATGALTITNSATGLALATTATNAGSTVVTNTASAAAPGQSWTVLS